MQDLFSQPTSSPTRTDASFLALNVQSPPPARARDLAIWLHENDADVLILTELSNAAGSTQLITDLNHLGYSALHRPPPARDYAAAILLNCDAIEPIPVPDELGSRVACCRLAGIARDAILVAAYVPSLGPQNHERRPLFLAKLSQFVADIQDNGDGVLLMGDLNVVERNHIPHIPAFEAEPLFAYDRFSNLGLTDAYRSFSPHGTDHSWYDRFGIGQRLDHAMMSPQLLGRASGCGYLHDVRTRRLSDHSGLSLRLRRTSD